MEKHYYLALFRHPLFFQICAIAQLCNVCVHVWSESRVVIKSQETQKNTKELQKHWKFTENPGKLANGESQAPVILLGRHYLILAFRCSSFLTSSSSARAKFRSRLSMTVGETSSSE